MKKRPLSYDVMNDKKIFLKCVKIKKSTRKNRRIAHFYVSKSAFFKQKIFFTMGFNSEF